VFHCVLHSLCYNIADMHKLTLNIHDVIAFSKWLSVKQILRNVLLTLKSVLYSHIWTLGTTSSLAPNFMYICTLVEHVIWINFAFESGE
jgi:hypothetical protein